MKTAFGLAFDGWSSALDTSALGLGRALSASNASTEGDEGFRLHDGLHWVGASVGESGENYSH